MTLLAGLEELKNAQENRVGIKATASPLVNICYSIDGETKCACVSGGAVYCRRYASLIKDQVLGVWQKSWLL